MLLDDIRLLFSYNAWANERLLACAAGLSADTFSTAALGSCHLHNTLRHILSAEVSWRSGWMGLDEDSVILPDVFPTVDALRARWTEENRAFDAFLATLTDDDMLRLMMFAPDPPEKLGQQMQHVILHGMQHRSEAALVLTELGHSPGWMDMIVFLNDLANRTLPAEVMGMTIAPL